jgi:Cys-rich repeat protein
MKRLAALGAVALAACPAEWHFSDDAGGGGCPAAGCPLSLNCSSTLERCVECTASSQCSAERPRCDTARGTCVECLSSADCDAGTVCEAAETFTCVPTCAVDAGCAVGRCTELPIGFICDACYKDDICEHMTVLRKCDLATRSCVRCSEDRNCAAPLSRCDRRTGTCRECIDSRDCTGGTFCVDGTCRAP